LVHNAAGDAESIHGPHRRRVSTSFLTTLLLDYPRGVAGPNKVRNQHDDVDSSDYDQYLQQ
jgi:hypothetical protein